MAKTNPLGVRVDPAIKTALDKAAADEGRTVSNMAERILSQWLKQNGYLNEGDNPKPRPQRKKPTE